MCISHIMWISLITGENISALQRSPETARSMGFTSRGVSVFQQNSVENLRHQIDVKAIHTTTKKVEAIKDAPTQAKGHPTISFLLGLLHYFGKFMPNMDFLLQHLNALYSIQEMWKWSSDCQKSFLRGCPLQLRCLHTMVQNFFYDLL